MPLSPFLASSRQPPVAASCSCCQPCSHGRHAGNIDCKTSRCSSTVRRVHSCERGSNEIPLQLLSIQLCQIYESIFLMLFSCHLWDFTDMPKQEQVEASFTCHLQRKCTVELNAEADGLAAAMCNLRARCHPEFPWRHLIRYFKILSVEVTAVKAVSYTCAKHSSLQTVDGATGVVGGGHTMHTYT